MMDNYSLEKLLTARQVANLLQVHITTVKRWSRSGMLKSYRLGSRGDLRYREADVLAFLNAGATGVKEEEAAS